MGKVLKLESVAVDRLIPYANNAKKHSDEQVQKIADSIREFGFLSPVLIDEEYNVIAGHGRILAAKVLGIENIPCVFADGLSEAQRRAYILADNRLTELADWDMDAVTSEIGFLESVGFETDLTGFDLRLDDEAQTIVTEDEFSETAEEEIEPRVVSGDIWALGRHRLICGDSTDPYTIERLMDGVKADMVMTDPPYGINAAKMTMGSGRKGFYRGENWDIKRPDIRYVLNLAPLVCVWGGNYFADVLPISRDWLVWHKKNDGLSFGECELAWTNFGRNIRHISHHWGKEKKLHVTMKPVSVIEWAMDQAKTRAEVVLDMFGGSGTTMVACERTGRTCYMAEIDPQCVDIIIHRWEELTGEKAVRVDEAQS